MTFGELKVGAFFHMPYDSVLFCKTTGKKAFCFEGRTHCRFLRGEHVVPKPVKIQVIDAVQTDK